ncbi:MAG: hypothetical protein AAGA54_26835 [Myxococcota bacterium]
MTFLEALARRPNEVGEDAVNRAIGGGATAADLEHASMMVALFSVMNRMVDAFGADVTQEQADAIGRALDTAGGAMALGKRSASWTRLRGATPARLLAQRDAIQTGDGDAPAELRTAIERHVARSSGNPTAESLPLPPELEAIAVTLAEDAHGMTDAHIQDGLHAGWSEEALYEFIFCAAFGSGLTRLERALTLLADR